MPPCCLAGRFTACFPTLLGWCLCGRRACSSPMIRSYLYALGTQRCIFLTARLCLVIFVVSAMIRRIHLFLEYFIELQCIRSPLHPERIRKNCGSLNGTWSNCVRGGGKCPPRLPHRTPAMNKLYTHKKWHMRTRKKGQSRRYY